MLDSPMTDANAKVFRFIIDFIQKEDRAPSMEEIRDALKMKSLSPVTFHLKKLVELGLIERRRGARGIILTGEGEEYARSVISAVMGSIAAGNPAHMEGDRDLLDSTMQRLFNADYLPFLVKGDSMTGAGISDGDIVIIRKQEKAEKGQIVAVEIEDFEWDGTLKVYCPEASRVRLRPANPAYEEIVIENPKTTNWRIIGVYVGLIRSSDGIMPERFMPKVRTIQPPQ